MNHTLFPHQNEGVKFLREARYALLGDEMGLGKTLTALSALESERVIIVTPASLKEVWALELVSRFPGRDFEVIDPKKIPASLTHIVITNYEQLEKMQHLFKDAHTVIADEAHYLKNNQAKRTKLFWKMIKNYTPHNLFLLTGTPIQNNVPEVWSLLCLLSFGKDLRNGANVYFEYRSKTRFCEELCFSRVKRIAGMMMTEWYGLRNKTELRRLLWRKYLARKLADVISLPPLREVAHKVAKLDREEELKLAFLQYQQGREIESPVKVQQAIEKAQFTVPFVRELLNAGKGPVVVFSDHVEPVRLITDALKSDFISGQITGNTPVMARNRLMTEFQAGLIDVLVCTIGAAGVGVTLTAACEMVFNDLPWVPSMLAQAKRRIYRIGQRAPCTIHFVTAPGFDSVLTNTLNSKSKIIHEALG